MLNDMMKKEGWTRPYALSILRSKFESEERHQEVAYVDDLIKNEGEEVEKEPKFEPTTTTTNTVAEAIIETKERAGTISSLRKPSKVTLPQQELEETISSKSISKQVFANLTYLDSLNRNIVSCSYKASMVCVNERWFLLSQ